MLVTNITSAAPEAQLQSVTISYFKGLIERLIRLYDGMPLGLRLPDVNNPFKTSAIGNLPIAGSPAFQGLMNSPATAASITVGAPNVQQQQQTAMAGQRVFGANDSIFGVG